MRNARVRYPRSRGRQKKTPPPLSTDAVVRLGKAVDICVFRRQLSYPEAVEVQPSSQRVV